MFYFQRAISTSKVSVSEATFLLIFPSISVYFGWEKLFLPPLFTTVRQVKGKFEKYLEHQAVTARHFDCVSIAHLGFVAVANYHDHELNVFDAGSPVFQIQEDGTTEVVQTFGQPNQHTVHLWVHGKNVYLTHTYTNLDASRPNVCPLYRWSGYFFDVVDHMPCYNAVQIEPFSIEQQMFVAVARQMAAGGMRKDSFSDIFVLNPDTQKLTLHQQIYTYSVSDIAYFFIEDRERREHFLMAGNSLTAGTGASNNEEGRKTSRDADQNSIVYKFVDGFFVPFQNVELNGVKMFLPVVHENGEFLLLVLCHDQPLLIYEYDGWKLVPSRIDYTGEAFAAGVAHMRVYRHIVNASVIVIANSNLFGKSVNLFTPQYGVENDLRQVYAHFIEWCERMHEQTAQVNLEELYNRLAELPDNAPDGARSIDKNIELQDSFVSKAKAGSIKTKNILIDDAHLSYVAEVNEYVQRVNDKMDLVEKTIHESVLTNGTVHWHGDLEVSELIAPAGQMKQLDVKVLNNGAHKTRQADDSTARVENDTTEVDRLIVDRFVNVRFWNGHAAESLLLIDDPPAKWKDVSVSAEKVVVGGNLYVNKLIDGIFFHPSNVLLPGVDQVLSGHNLVVKDLNVNRLTSKRLNSTDAAAVHRMMDQSRTLLAKSRGAMPQAYGNDFDTIDVDELKLTGLLNDMDPRYLTDNVLLHEAENQELVAKLVVDQITADNIVISDSKLSGIEWENVARINGAQQILQDLQFVQPITVDSLVLRDRLNHIPVIDGKLQVLLLDSNETQSITGTKTFDYVTLLKPIELQGKIDGDALSKMNPIVTTVEDLVLDGNYTILGNVTFNGPLWAHNIMSASGSHDFHRLATHGLRLDGTPASDQVIRFLQPVFVEHLGANKINELDVADLVPQAAGTVQYITGRKTFIGDLIVDGVADANEINKVDLNQLNRTIFRRGAEGVEQTIEGTIHFDTIITSVTNAKNILFEGKRMDRLLRFDIPQNVSAPVRFENCTIYVENAVVAQELQTDNSSLVFGYDMDYLYQDTLRPETDVATEAPVVVGHKSFRNLTVGQLVLLDGSTINSIAVENIKHILDDREKRTVIKQELYSFQGDITVNHLYFNGSINGIPKHLFCRAWLMRTGDQTFTVEQTFDTVMVEHLNVTGKLNGDTTMDQLLENVYRTDREEYINQAIFHEGIVSYEPCSVGGLVSGLDLSNDVLLKQSPEIQTLGTVQVSQTLEARGELHILNNLNGIHFPKLMEFFSPADDKERAERLPPNVEVRGNVYFEHDPTLIHLNGHNIQKLYDEVWLPHRPTVLTGRYHFESVEFQNSLHTNPVNHLDWNVVEARCLSGKRPQNISAPLLFEGDVTVYAGAVFDTLGLKGMLKSMKNSPGLDVHEYDRNVLRYNENQEITGKWTFHNLQILGDLHINMLNGHNVQTDYMRTDVSANNFTVTKRFRELHVESIVCPPPCVIQEVDMDEWYKNGLRLKGNQTLEGTLRIVDGVITGNVEVLGTVNGVRYDVDHLLLKSVPQSVNGTMSLITKFPKENKIFPLVFESLHAQTINRKDVAKFLTNAARNDKNPLTIRNSVTFVNPLEVEETLLEGDMLFGTNITHLILSTSYHTGVNELEAQVRSLNSVNEKLSENVFESSPVFSHFEKLKSLPIHAVRMLVFTLPLFPKPVEVVAVHMADSSRPSAINFYLWNSKESRLMPAKNIPSIVGRERVIVNMKRLNLGKNQHMFLQFFKQESNYFIQQILDLHVDPTGVNKFAPLYVMNSTRARDVIWMKLGKLDCIIMYSKGMIGFEVRCLREQNLIPILDVRQLEETVAPIQIVALENHFVMLDNNDRIQIWRPTVNFYLKHHQTIAVSRPSYISVARYENQLMLAINSEHTPNTAHHGSIEVWRKSLTTLNSTFTQHQLILTKVPKQLQFSVLPSNELLLYTLTENWLHPLVVYRYEGVTGFREVLTSNTIRQKAKRLSVLKFRQARKEIVAIVGPESTDFVNVVFV
ncbi:AGAP011897-PA-like protein [Anopheles sinensis]|uniref:AGAP011897-PA-like protein n=1 Tax=Anopheles sinensis TaxID=74873 RepID=A0A084WIN1_ANOSI|nr:AGAP011897-PA-like protein [Anopheles sinensis]